MSRGVTDGVACASAAVEARPSIDTTYSNTTTTTSLTLNPTPSHAVDTINQSARQAINIRNRMKEMTYTNLA